MHGFSHHLPSFFLMQSFLFILTIQRFYFMCNIIQSKWILLGIIYYQTLFSNLYIYIYIYIYKTVIYI